MGSRKTRGGKLSVAPGPGTCCRQSWGKAELATRHGGVAEVRPELALERAQLKQPPVLLVVPSVVASVVVVVRNAVERLEAVVVAEAPARA